MVISFLHTLPPVAPRPQTCGYHHDNGSLNDEKRTFVTSSARVHQQHHHHNHSHSHRKHQQQHRMSTTTRVAERLASADPFVHAEETWTTFNSASYSIMVQSIRDVLSLLTDKKKHRRADTCTIKQQQETTKVVSHATTTAAATADQVSLTVRESLLNHNHSRKTKEESKARSQQGNHNDDTDAKNIIGPLFTNHNNEAEIAYCDGHSNSNSSGNNKEHDEISAMTVPLCREISLRQSASDNNNSSDTRWLWSIIPKYKAEDDKVDDLPFTIQPGSPAQQKQPLWSLTHSYIRDTRINSSEYRMLSAERSMIRGSKITRPLRNRRYQQRREDDFVWGRRSYLRIVRVGERKPTTTSNI